MLGTGGGRNSGRHSRPGRLLGLLDLSCATASRSDLFDAAFLPWGMVAAQ